MKTSVAVLFALLLACFPAMGKDKTETQEWEWHGAGEAGAWLRTEKNESTVRFNLELNRGSPSYNSGIASGEFTLNRYLGIYQTHELPKCVLVFAFVGDSVEIQQLGSDSDCGFGFGVTASHVLTLKRQAK